MSTVEERHEQRVMLLKELHRATNGRPGRSRVHFTELAKALSMSDEGAESAAEWLVDRDLAAWPVMGGFLDITPLGVDQVESWEQEDSGEGTAAATVLTVVELRAVEQFIGDLRAALERGDVPDDPDDRSELEAMAETLEVQGRSARPSRRIIETAMYRVGELMETVAGGILANVAFELVKRLAG